jgi:hypothetical protein
MVGMMGAGSAILITNVVLEEQHVVPYKQLRFISCHSKMLTFPT